MLLAPPVVPLVQARTAHAYDAWQARLARAPFVRKARAAFLAAPPDAVHEAYHAFITAQRQVPELHALWLTWTRRGSSVQVREARP